ncbi:MAG: RluA family pseudouridine synthase [Erysipelotrichaceae bacterium]|jgi:23S rRNA pseudouridine1911/1915/1917 synthase|nr:RluA family pseudouridine synthase [Erysipelotrichaceae bacterium]
MKLRTDQQGLHLSGSAEEIRAKTRELLSARYRDAAVEQEGEIFLPFLYESCPKKENKTEILYKDQFLAVARKPKGLLVHDDGNASANLQDRVSEKLGIRVQALHRLDTDTDGPVLFSLSPVFQAAADRMVFEKKMHREYLAFVEGKVEKESFTVNKAIGKDRHRSNVYRVSGTGKEACTHFELLGTDGRNSVLCCKLETGRRHQIRVHLSSAGHPILGDTLYGHSGPLPLGLSAVKLSFVHPVFGKEITVTCDFDERYKKIYRSCMGKDYEKR